MRRFCFIVFIFIGSFVNAQVLYEGEGSGKTEKEAIETALMDISLRSESVVSVSEFMKQSSECPTFYDHNTILVSNSLIRLINKDLSITRRGYSVKITAEVTKVPNEIMFRMKTIKAEYEATDDLRCSFEIYNPCHIKIFCISEDEGTLLYPNADVGEDAHCPLLRTGYADFPKNTISYYNVIMYGSDSMEQAYMAWCRTGQYRVRKPKNRNALIIAVSTSVETRFDGEVTYERIIQWWKNMDPLIRGNIILQETSLKA